ncbi:hypothetical protein IMZ48_31685 [Candidatus Bathyarchaeota archaeon]|nr:hypothetical protein [Candidatus Bathyarchaeota archaeon]
MHDEVISFMLAKGADTSTSARGLFRDWTAVDIAHYHNEDRYVIPMAPLSPGVGSGQSWRAPVTMST